MKGWDLEAFKQSEAAKRPENAHILEPVKKERKKAKYNNTKVEYEGMVFDSKKEYKRYRELIIKVKLGEITIPERQKEFILVPAQEGERKMSYFADFVYQSQRTGERIVEDVKSDATRKLSTYIAKRKLMLKIHGIKIQEV
jgi:hypothetical protein